MSLKCVILDDDELPRKVIEDLVEKTDFLELVKSCEDPMDAANVLNNNQIDLLFLDVEMPGMTGIELIKSLIQRPQVILITSHEKYAVEAFEYDVTDYIVKPVSKSRFFKAVSKAKEFHESKKASGFTGGDEGFFFVKVDSKMVKINFDEILWVEAMANYLILNTEKGKHIVRSTMKEMEERLAKNDFLRVHRSYIIPMSKIDQIEDNTIDIQGKMVPVGGAYKEELQKRLSL